jgi:glycine cleavage system protein P-like pyridoxal-binding family
VAPADGDWSGALVMAPAETSAIGSASSTVLRVNSRHGSNNASATAIVMTMTAEPAGSARRRRRVRDGLVGMSAP